MSQKKTNKTTSNIINNGILTNLTAGLQYQSSQNLSPISQIDALLDTVKLISISNNPIALTGLYLGDGIIKRIIDTPIYDAFKGNIVFRADNLDTKELSILTNDFNSNVYSEFTRACCLARLFGGGGIVLTTNNENVEEELTINEIEEGFKLYASDLWELNNVEMSTQVLNFPNLQSKFDNPTPYSFYGKKLHKTRAVLVKNSLPPYYAKGIYRGWGVSEIERIIMPYNQYTKTRKALFEMIDEAKVSVIKMPQEILSQASLNEEARIGLNKILQEISQLKNIFNTIVMATESDFQQVQPNFAWVEQVSEAIRSDFSASCGFPKNKLYGDGASGFSSGQDSLENYNTMLEGVRKQFAPILTEIMKLRCQYLFKFTPEELSIDFPSLRVETGEQEEMKKNHQFNRVMQAFQGGLLKPEEALNQLNVAKLLPKKIEEEPNIDFPNPPQQNDN